LKSDDKKAAILPWSTADEARLKAMKEVQGKGWVDIAKCFPGRTQKACEGRYHHVLKDEGEKGVKLAWSSAEEALLKAMKESGKSWMDIEKCFTGRTVLACEQKYYKHLQDGASPMKRQRAEGISVAPQSISVGNFDDEV
jgi:hypothetical protein